MKKKSNYTLTIFGGTSGLARDYVICVHKECLKVGLSLDVRLIARNEQDLQRERYDYLSRGIQVETYLIAISSQNVLNIDSEILDGADEFFIAYGELTDQQNAQKDTIYLKTQLDVNFTSVCILLEGIARQCETQNYGQVTVIGSVAGDRGRQSNYAYGAAKSGLETYVQGLSHRFGQNKDVNFTLIKPGFIITKMTKDFDRSGLLWTSSARAASLIRKNVVKKRSAAYVPFFWFFIMSIIQAIPNFIYKNTRL